MRFANELGAYEIDNLPGCSQVAVSNQAFVKVGFRGKGVGTKLHQERLKVIEDLGYDYALCTVDLSNTAQISILTKAEWLQIDSFVSSKTGHRVGIFGKHFDLAGV
jgi:GNAT superfamily N-acetyltransferase